MINKIVQTLILIIFLSLTHCSGYKELNTLKDNEVPKWFAKVEKQNQSKAVATSPSMEMARIKAINLAVNKLMVKKFGRSAFDTKISITEDKVTTETAEVNSKILMNEKEIINYKILKEDLVISNKENKKEKFTYFVLVENK
jgi:hypothetical protein